MIQRQDEKQKKKKTQQETDVISRLQVVCK